MLVILGSLTIACLLLAIFFNRMSPVVALTLIPATAALIGGFGLETATFMVNGIRDIAPVAGMFVFAILFFGVMTDAGLLEPLLRGIIKVAGSRPRLIVPATALLALIVHLDGAGAVCFLIVIPAMLPLYDRLGMDRRILACVTALMAGNNVLPWMAPTLRASASLKIPAIDIVRPMLGAQAMGLLFVFAVSIWFGLREEKRLGWAGGAGGAMAALPSDSDAVIALRRPKVFWINLLLTIAVLASMIVTPIPPVVLFMAGTALALLINYPHAKEQRERVDAHARAALLMASVLVAAGAFTGIMSGTGMLRAMATGAVEVLPEGTGTHIPFILSLIAMPLSFVFDPDSFYFGVLPILAHTVEAAGGTALQTAQAALVGQSTAGFPLTPLTPVSFLLVGLCRLDLSTHQRFTIPYAYATSLIVALFGVLFGVIPL